MATDFSVLAFLKTAAMLASPLILASLGGLLSERSGVINIALEGKMLISACVTALAAVATGNPWIGLAAGLASSMLLSLLHWLLTQSYRLDHIVSGMALNALAYGVTKFLNGRVADQRAAGFPHVNIWLFVTLALLLPLAMVWVVRRTRFGLRLTAVGNDPEKCRANGLEPVRVRLVALVGTGLLCGLSGAMIVTDAGQFGDNMTAGKGFIALAGLILGGWRALPVLAACAAFGAVDALQLQLQGTRLAGVMVPSEAWNALPYLATLAALGIFRIKAKPPSALGTH